MMAKSSIGANAKVCLDIAGHHALCELNFHRLMRLIPGYQGSLESWRFQIKLSDNKRPGAVMDICINAVDKAPYTTTLDILQSAPGGVPETMQVRLYHDVEMAEILSWNEHKNFRSHYPYPNRNMYQPDEKQSLNRYLGEWLVFCLNHAYAQGENVTDFS